jgi:hypothetical protein
VAAFEEQVGCHGGLGGYQTRPFVLVPSSWTVPDEDLFGAESIYEIFRRRLDEAVLSEEEIGARSEEQEGRTIEGAAEFDAEMAAADRAAASAASDAADARAMDSGVPPGHQEPPTG